MLNKKEKNKVKRSLFVTLIIIIEFFVYEISILITYLYVLSQEEALALSSMYRYSSNFILAITAMCVLLLFYEFSKLELNKSIINSLILTVLLIMCVPIDNVVFSVTKPKDYIMEQYAIVGFDKYYGLENKLDSILTTDDYVYFLSLDDSYGFHCLRKILLPAKTMNYLEQVTLENTFDIWPEFIIENEFDYVFVGSSREDFNEKYSYLFENNTIKDLTLYKVDYTNSDVMFHEVSFEMN